ncbi:DUF1643 domain-containing protein [Paenibacillus elgii]|uniref:DUF1643 domain-containing protein n=1 Tax=Paenibacillus elgii TaxID=189691 RepID=UPI000FDC4195|nr:DUF1643 domain-containing protein [Paenibacillus elgii]NEN82580.1 DUF1643 domain-containing protein [Paenibacillus elgii]
MVRSWDTTKDKAAIIMFNPARVNPVPFRLGSTLSNIVMHLEKENIGSFEVVNLYPYTSDKKDLLPEDKRKFDENNYKHIEEAVNSSEIVVLFWGNDNIVSRNPRFVELLMRNTEKLRCFRVTSKNCPDYIYGLSLKHSLQKCTISENGDITIKN